MKINLITSLLVLCLAFSIGVVQAQTEGNVLWVPVNENATTFDVTPEPVPFSGNFTSINGTFYMNLTDLDPMAISPSNDSAKAMFNFTDPSGNTKYAVVLRQIDNVVESFFTYNCAFGNASTEKCVATTYTYGIVWGLGDLYVNDTLVNDNRILRIMASERVNSSDEEGYKLLFDKVQPHQGIETRLFLPDLVVTKNGTLEKQPVPTNVTLSDGQYQSFINVIFKNCQLEGHRIFFNNTTVNTTGNITEGMKNTT